MIIMEVAIKDIISKTYELEGLLLLAKSRTETGLEEPLRRLIVAKKNEVANMIDDAFGETADCSIFEPEPQPVEPPADEPIEEIVSDDEPVNELFDDSLGMEPADEPEPYTEPVAEPLAEPEPIAEPVIEPEPIEEPVDEPEPDDAPLDEEYDDEEDDDDDDELLDDEEEGLTLDEALQRSMSRDLRRAFSLNDRFRYRRELFGNSDVEMNDTLNLVETMHSYSEAEEFFYGDLEWDRESPEVKDFMTIIKNHFLTAKS